MKTILALSAVCTSAFLFSGCLVPDEGHAGYRHGYDGGPRYHQRADVVVYSDGRDRGHYDHDRNYNRGYDRDYSRRDVNRTNVYERNVYRTNVRENDVNLSRSRQVSNDRQVTAVQRGSVNVKPSKASEIKVKKKQVKKDHDSDNQ